jgi:hypothetical protein
MLIDAKNKAPLKTGDLRADSGIESPRPLVKRIYFDKEYAVYQEKGSRRDGTRVVRKYTTAGTGKEFLKNAGDKQRPLLKMKIKKHTARVKV